MNTACASILNGTVTNIATAKIMRVKKATFKVLFLQSGERLTALYDLVFVCFLATNQSPLKERTSLLSASLNKRADRVILRQDLRCSTAICCCEVVVVLNSARYTLCNTIRMQLLGVSTG